MSTKGLVLLMVASASFVVRQQHRLRRHAGSTQELAQSFGPDPASASEKDAAGA